MTKQENSVPDSEGAHAQALLNQMVFQYMRDQKRQRFWRVVKHFIGLIILGWLIYVLFYQNTDEALKKAKPHVGVIDIMGEIDEQKAASADNLMKGLKKAYANKNLKALVLRINSPGGSPVQADYMFNTLRFFQNKYKDIKVYAVCEDLCASAAYYAAAATSEIYANPSSMVGSIGVLYNGFGYVDTMQKLGVTRRLQTAGRNKGFMDQFSPVTPQQTAHLQTMLDSIHQRFISQVKTGRGDRLLIDEDTFSGLFWTGDEAKKRGLIDGFSSTGQLARDIIKVDQIVDYTAKPSMLEQVAGNVGTSIANQLPEALGLKPSIR